MGKKEKGERLVRKKRLGRVVKKKKVKKVKKAKSVHSDDTLPYPRPSHNNENDSTWPNNLSDTSTSDESTIAQNENITVTPPWHPSANFTMPNPGTSGPQQGTPVGAQAMGGAQASGWAPNGNQMPPQAQGFISPYPAYIPQQHPGPPHPHNSTAMQKGGPHHQGPYSWPGQMHPPTQAPYWWEMGNQILPRPQLFNQNMDPTARFHPYMSQGHFTGGPIGLHQGPPTHYVQGLYQPSGQYPWGQPSSFTKGNIIPEMPMVDTSSSMLDTISTNIKNKIWNNEFIELAKLLEDDDSDEDVSSNVTEVLVKNGRQIYLPNKKVKKYLVYPEWQRAFLIFIKIYTQKHPWEAGDLASYMALIHKLKQKIRNWGRYGRLFRKAKANRPCSWAALDQVLYYDCLNLPTGGHQTG
ncbi:unnamed protein product [Owenia fusiformis]|uniref:Uncharacterized protein n=1 Tax=Owenia fusiformis TaxID=6347 RepID=A0A8S4N0Y1_OWEFU|nr:unnamed protein product [Owenia fusiformis]